MCSRCFRFIDVGCPPRGRSGPYLGTLVYRDVGHPPTTRCVPRVLGFLSAVLPVPRTYLFLSSFLANWTHVPSLNKKTKLRSHRGRYRPSAVCDRHRVVRRCVSIARSHLCQMVQLPRATGLAVQPDRHGNLRPVIVHSRPIQAGGKKLSTLSGSRARFISQRTCPPPTPPHCLDSGWLVRTQEITKGDKRMGNSRPQATPRCVFFPF